MKRVGATLMLILEMDMIENRTFTMMVTMGAALMTSVVATAAVAPPGAASAKPTRKPVQNLVEAAKRVRSGEIVPLGRPADARSEGMSANGTTGAAPSAPPVIAPTVQQPAKSTPVDITPPIAAAAEPESNSTQPPVSVPAAEPTPTLATAPAAPLDPRTPSSSSVAGRGATPAIRSPREFVTGEHRFVAVDSIVLTVESVIGDPTLAQYRTTDGPGGKPGEWQPITTTTPLRGRYEIRTGVGTSVRVREEGGATCTVGPVSRVGFERRVRSDGSSQPGANIARGRIHANEERASALESNVSGSPDPGRATWIVRTPDGSYLIDSGELSFDGIDRTKNRSK